MLRRADRFRAENPTAAAFTGLSVADLLRVQKAIHERRPRYCARSAGKAGYLVAEVLGLDATADRQRIKRLIETWIANDALRVVEAQAEGRAPRLCLEVAEWADQ